MNKQPSNIALLESAFAAIERVLARADGDLHGVPYFGPTANAPLEDFNEAGLSEDHRVRASAAQSAINICLSSAAALIDVSQALMDTAAGRSPLELERAWKGLITHTKTASRSAYRAALIMAAQKNVVAAQAHGAAEEARRVPH
ncbi:MAG: hypothetical protein EOP82_17555 [Variovorax sp.]|nr:MAG: hypothetical protein EOP82_17555 [Variovorax sp.]